MKEIITPTGKIALALDTVIDISKNTPLFTRAEEFSLDLEVPRIPNERILGYKYRMAAKDAIDPLDGIDVPIDAVMTLNGRPNFWGSIEVAIANRDTYGLLLKGNRNDFMYKYGATKLRDLVFGFEHLPDYSFPYQPLESEQKAAMLATIETNQSYICFPVYNPVTQTWINKWSFDQNTFSTDPTNGVRTLFLRMYAALERLFTLKGYTVTENWFRVTDERKNIVIYNNADEGVKGQFDIRYLYPDWTIIDFLNEIEDYFPVTIFIDAATKTVRIMGDDDIVNSAPVGELKGYLERDYQVVFNEKKDGYQLDYTLPQNDDSTKSDYKYADEAYNGEVNKKSDLPTVPFADVVYLVLAEGNYYKSEISDQAILSWVLKGSVALGIREEKNEITRATKIYPMMETTIKQTETVTITKQYVGTKRVDVGFDMVVPYTMKEPNKWGDDFRPMLYRGFDTATVDPDEIEAGYQLTWKTYPMANFVNRKVDGSRWSGQVLELRWDGDMGLRGAGTIAFLEGADTINAKFIINQSDLLKLDNARVYTMDGRRVVLSEMVIHYAETDHIEVDVVLLAQKNI